MSTYSKPTVTYEGSKGDVQPEACNVCLVGGIVAAIWQVGAVWDVAAIVAYAVGALVVIKGLGPEC